jgi:hypothetical protein
LLAPAFLLAAALPVHAKPARELTPLEVQQALTHQRAVARQMKQDAIWEGARGHFEAARERAELIRRARSGNKAALRGLRARRAGEDEGAPISEALPAGPAERGDWPLVARSTAAVPTNVRVNDPSGDLASTGQAEEFVAAIGSDIVVAWNDGQGFNTGGDIQGFGWSHDGGATFTDQGTPPHPGGFPAWRWTSDPVMTVNEKTGYFYYCGLANSDASHNAIAVARGRFTAGVFAFDSVFVVRNVPSASTFLDKQWIACDSLSGNLYVTNTTFGGLDTIDFYRSTDGGRTWAGPLVLSASSDAGWVQGSRVSVAPNGDVETVWYAQDQVTDEDNLRFRRSTNFGVSFGSEVTPVKFNAQFGTGGPGFNRERGINFPSIAVDRSSGAHRGRIYLSWQECWHFLAVALPPGGSTDKSEIESNGTAATATACTAGQTLRGTLTTTSNTADQDWWSMPLTAGQSVIVFADSVTASRGWYLRLLSPDGVQRLCFGGKPDSTTGSNFAYYTFTAPASGTYYLRMIQTSKQNVSYRIRTGLGGQTVERGRDQRDAFVSSSDNGTTWSTPVRINDDALGYDLFLPEIAVAADGMPYVKWFDHRDDLYGTRANVYLTRSANGGATWAANQPITSAQGNFTTSGTNIAPNMGDYSGMTSSGVSIVPTWADARSVSSVDVWSTTVATTSNIASGPNDTTMSAPGTATFGWNLANANPVFGGTYGTAVSCARAWTVTAPATAAIAAAANTFYTADVSVPDTAANGVVNVCLTLTSPGGVVVGQDCFAITVTGGSTGTGPVTYHLALAPSRPNPSPGAAMLGITLPHTGEVRLGIYDLSGGRVRTLVDGVRPAGTTQVAWDGLDDHGRPVRSGAYFYRLEFEGADLARRLVMLK